MLIMLVSISSAFLFLNTPRCNASIETVAPTRVTSFHDATIQPKLISTHTKHQQITKTHEPSKKHSPRIKHALKKKKPTIYNKLLKKGDTFEKWLTPKLVHTKKKHAKTSIKHYPKLARNHATDAQHKKHHKKRKHQNTLTHHSRPTTKKVKPHLKHTASPVSHHATHATKSPRYHPHKYGKIHLHHPHHINHHIHSRHHNFKLSGSIDNIVHYTLSTNPDVLSAKANQRAQYHNLQEARGGYYPSIDLSYSHGREFTKTQASTVGIADNDRVWLSRTERRIAINQMIFDGWSVSSRVHSNQAKYIASQYQTFTQETNTALQAIEAQLDVLRFRQLYYLGIRNVSLHLDTLRKVKSLYKGGAGNKADVELAGSRLSLARSTLIASNRAKRNALAVFESVVGKMAKQHLRVPRLNLKFLPKSLKTAIDIAIVHSPLIHSEHHLYAASRYDIDSAKSAFYPKVSLELSSSNNNNVDGVVGFNRDQQALLVVSYNLFRGGSDKAALGDAREKSLAAHEALLKSYRTVRRNVTQAWNDLRAARARLRQQKIRAQTSAEVVAAYRKQFRLGKRSLINLLDTERELFNARNDLVNGRFDVLRDTYSLYASMGILLRPNTPKSE